MAITITNNISRSNKTTTQVTLHLCSMQSGDVPLKYDPSKDHSGKKYLKSNSHTVTCSNCNKSIHINCTGISKQ